MSALTVNGIDLSVAAQNATHGAPLIIGDSGRAFSGKWLDTVRARKDVLRLATPPLIQTDAAFIRGLLLGLGHSWSFDTDLYSDGKGLGPSSSSGSPAAGTAGGRYGNCVNIPVAGSLAYQPGLAGLAQYGVHFWRKRAGVWHHYLIDTGSAVYLDGVNMGTGNVDMPWYSNDGTTVSFTGLSGLSAAWAGTTHYNVGHLTLQSGSYYEVQTAGTTGGSAPSWGSAPSTGNTLTDGGVTWINVGTGAVQIDDLVVMPYVVQSPWSPLIYTAANLGVAWQPNPTLYVRGDLCMNALGQVMQAVLEDSTLLQFASSGSWQDNGEQLTFTLTEV